MLQFTHLENGAGVYIRLTDVRIEERASVNMPTPPWVRGQWVPADLGALGSA